MGGKIIQMERREGGKVIKREERGERVSEFMKRGGNGSLVI